MSNIHDIEKQMADLADQMKRMQVELETAMAEAAKMEMEHFLASALFVLPASAPPVDDTKEYGCTRCRWTRIGCDRCNPDPSAHEQGPAKKARGRPVTPAERACAAASSSSSGHVKGDGKGGSKTGHWTSMEQTDLQQVEDESSKDEADSRMARIKARTTEDVEAVEPMANAKNYLRFYFVCQATHGTHPRCFTMLCTSKGSRRKYPTLELLKGQAYYCEECQAKYKQRWGCLVEFSIDGVLYYMRAPVPDTCTLDMLAAMAEKFNKPGMSTAELFNRLPSVPPQSSTFVKMVSEDVMKITDPHLFDSLNEFPWSQIMNMEAVDCTTTECCS